MGKASLIVVIGAFSIFFLVSKNINETLGSATNYAVGFFSEVQARNIANSTAEMLLSVIADNNSYRASTPVTLSDVWDGYAEYTVKDTVLDGNSLIKIQVTGYYFNNSKKISVYCYVPQLINFGFVPMAIKGAISTNNPINTLGTLVVDGRNHDLSGNVIAGTGTYGIWTTNPFVRSGNSKIGGTDSSGTDHTPKKNYDSSAVAENQPFPGGYPDTPDSVFGGTPNGYPPGKLKAIAKTGALGSQYVTDPADLSYPLAGVTYVNLPAGGSWIDANITGGGILIVHNPALDAIVKSISSGPFKGILIADDLDKIHIDIIGAVVVLIPNPPSGNTIGNGSGSVLYSSDAIAGVTSDAAPGFVDRYGFNRRRMPVVHWDE